MIEILTHQAKFLKSNAVHTGLVAGFGSGKSIAATIKTIEKKKQYPNISVAYYLPTYSLIKDIAFPNFEKYLQMMGITYDLNKSDKEFNTEYGKIIMRSIDSPEYIIGYEVGYSLIDEADIPPKDKMRQVLVNVVARNRKKLPNGEHNSLDFVSTPEGFRFMYDFFVKNKDENRVLIKARTMDNPYLPSAYIETLKGIYSATELEAYLNGEFVNITSGNVYYAFNRVNNHSDREVEDSDILHVGMDFNINQMCAIVNVIDNGIATAVAEYINYYNTDAVASKIKQDFPNNRVIVYPDASGKNRKTSAAETDINILKKYNFGIKALTSNPFVRDRINTMNKVFENQTVFINTYKCPIFTEHLETIGYKNDEPDKSINHSTDAMGYFVWYNYGKAKPKVYL